MKTNTKQKQLSTQDKKAIKTLRAMRKSGRVGKANYWIVKGV